MDKKIGFIGGGNMGSAILGGILSAGLVRPDQITVSDVSESLLAEKKETFQVQTTTDNCANAAQADFLFLAVKPDFYPVVIRQIRDVVRPETVVISIAAGRTLAYLAELFDCPVKLVRAMPNTPALVGAGMAAVCPGKGVTDHEMVEIHAIFESFGKVQLVKETMMGAVTAVSGSSPAYVFLFIEALADGAVAGGMPRAQAYTFAAQAVLGSAQMVLETGRHPGELKDMVCSPGGTTIDAVAELEKKGMRAAVISAVEACIRKSKEMTL